MTLVDLLTGLTLQTSSLQVAHSVALSCNGWACLAAIGMLEFICIHVPSFFYVCHIKWSTCDGCRELCGRSSEFQKCRSTGKPKQSMETNWFILNSALVSQAEQISFPSAPSVDRSLELIFSLMTEGQIVLAKRCRQMPLDGRRGPLYTLT